MVETDKQSQESVNVHSKSERDQRESKRKESLCVYWGREAEGVINARK